MTRFVIMGVAGCGKTSIGEAMAAALPLAFVDGDDLHPAENIAKMSAGTPLTDEDRLPWLADVGRTLGGSSEPMAIGCSALKRQYRNLIRREAPAVHFLHLHAPQEVISARMKAREGHFMPPALLDSQFAALEPLAADEAGTVIDIDRPLDAVIEAAIDYARPLIT